MVLVAIECLVLDCGCGWVLRVSATGWDCCCGLERGGHRLKPIPKAGIVFKSSLVLSGKAAKDNFTTEPRSPSRLLNRIELICNRGEGFDEVILQASGQTIPTFLMVRQG